MNRLAYILITINILLFTSCDNDFLEKYPKTSLNEANAFITNENYEAFMNANYGVFQNTDIATNTSNRSQNAQYIAEYNSGNFIDRRSFNPYAFQTIETATTGNGWAFHQIRRNNIMLSHLNDDNNTLTDEDKSYWRSVAYFFHSFWYMEYINRFGDIPWITEVLHDSSPEAYGPRDDRKQVADSVLARLKWAEENIGEQRGHNTISQDVIQATISRFTLREGTWRKYHDLGDYEKYFIECIRVSEILMDKYPQLNMGTDGQPAAGYGEMWTSPDLSQVPGVIFYKEYRDPIKMHNNSYHEHTASQITEMPQYTVDMYLCKDGKTIYNSPLYEGDKDIYSTFRNRDPRMYHVIMPPYRVRAQIGDYSNWSYTSNAADREYIDIMGPNSSSSNPGTGMKRLPAQNWGASLLAYTPNLFDGIGKRGTKVASFVTSRSGYYVWKNYSQWEENHNRNERNTSDKPIFKIEEVLLNYAEAKWELNQFTQDVADISINKLRNRAGVSNMFLSEINSDFDPYRDQTVDPILWEIRRERMIELMGEGFSFDDIRRWKKAPWYINRQQTGMWINRDDITGQLWDENTHLPTRDKTEGYIYVWADPLVEGKGWLDRYYLYQVPTDEIVMNPNLTQNPGY